MQKALVLGLVGVVASSVACGDAGTGSSAGLRRGGPAAGIPEVGETTEHDADDVDVGAADPGNPNASTLPTAPSDPAGQAERFAVSLSTVQPAVDLGADVTIDVTVAQKNGFTGPVDLSVTGLPAGVTAAFTPAQVDVAASPATARLVLTSAMTAIPSAPNTSSAIQVVAKSGATEAAANANFKVNPRMTLTIPMNVDALRQANVGTQFKNEWGTAFGTTPSTLQTQEGNGIVVVVRNADSTAHIVHSAGAFPHGDTARPIAPNDFEKLANGDLRTRTLSPTAAAPVRVSGYPHDGANGPSVSFRIMINAAP